MKERYFINRFTRQARIGHGKAFARQQIELGFEEVTRSQFDSFRSSNRAWFAEQVAS